jgi:extradiol dioxygenase family protein
MSALRPFHVAVTVRDLDEARKFYCELLGCEEGRSDADWIDFNLFGHQYVCHRLPDGASKERGPQHHNFVDGKKVPVPHYGVVLSLDEWEQLAQRLFAADVQFIIEPYIRFRGQPGEQGTLFISDPSGNALEFKGFRDFDTLFAG